MSNTNNIISISEDWWMLMKKWIHSDGVKKTPGSLNIKQVFIHRMKYVWIIVFSQITNYNTFNDESQYDKVYAERIVGRTTVEK